MPQARRDPEVDQLLRASRVLTGRAFNLSRSIDATIEELREFHHGVEHLDTSPPSQRRLP